MLSYKELLAKKLELDNRIQKVHQEEADEALATVKHLIATFEFTLQQVFPLPQRTRGKYEAKYCDPDTGQTWSGQGKPPKWIQGEDRKAFEIDRTPVMDYRVPRDERNPFPVQ